MCAWASASGAAAGWLLLAAAEEAAAPSPPPPAAAATTPGVCRCVSFRTFELTIRPEDDEGGGAARASELATPIPVESMTW